MRCAVPSRAGSGAVWRGAAAVVLGLALARCDTSPALDIETPAFEPAVVVRAVLAAGRTPTVRLSVSGDPSEPVSSDRPPSATPAGAAVVLIRDGFPDEPLAAQPQTCYTAQQSRCDPETGRVETTRSGAYACGAFVGSMHIEAGATYTIRATVPGLPPAEATVTVPRPADVTVDDLAPGGSEPRTFRVSVRDAAPGPTRYGVSLFRDFDAYTTQVCRVGGPRDTTVTLAQPWRYQGRFATSDPLLLSDAPAPAASFPFATFTDATFDGGSGSVVIRSDPARPGNVVPGRGYAVQVSVLSPTLYEAYRTAAVLFGEPDPFASPTDLPGNVRGGFGLVGAVATVEAVVPR